MAESEFSPAPEVERIAHSLIPECHGELTEARITYLFTSKKRKKNNRIILGTAQKIRGLTRYLSGSQKSEPECDFVIIVGWDEWKKLNEKQRAALVDHELCHCMSKGDDDDGEPIWGIRSHDLEEFQAVVSRHGLWKSDVIAFADTIKQLALPESR